MYHQHELQPELSADDVWRIFNLDQEYGKFTQQKNQVMQFFKNLQAIQESNQVAELANFILHLDYVKSKRELKNYECLIEFYKSYYKDEIEKASQKDEPSKKLPG